MTGRAAYQVVFETLKDEIVSGKYGASSAFPSSTALARRFKTSRATIRRALDELHHQGLVDSRQGRVTFVTRTGRERKIGLIMPGLATSEFFQPLATTLIRLAQEHDYELQFGDVYPQDSAKRVQAAKDLAADFVRRRVSGIIYQPLEYAFDKGETNRRILAVFDRANIPVVLLDSEIVLSPGRSGHDLVSIDNVAAGKMAAAHLLDAGARNVHFVMRTNWYPNVRDRLDGVICALAERGFAWSRRNLLLAEPDDVEAVRRHLRQRPRPDAFVCESDPTAAVFMRTLDALHVKVPEDMMLASFDDVNIARQMTPPLTSVRQPCARLAESAFARLLARIARPDLPLVMILHPVTLTVRRSSSRNLAAK